MQRQVVNQIDNWSQTVWPKVTVVIVNWNGCRYLQRCLSALCGQTVAPHEIILLDNASSDDSLEIVHSFSAVRVLAQTENLGFARGNNLALTTASDESEWFALLNPDAFVEPRWLEELLKAALNFPEFAVFGSKLVNATYPSLLDGAGDVYHISGLVWREGFGATVSSVSECEREIFSPCAAAALYRRDVWQAADGLDEDYFCYVEDVDLGFRLRLLGYRCLFVPGAVAHHVGSGTSGGRHSKFSVYYGHRNLVWTFVKDMPGLLFWLMLPLHLILNLVSLVWLAAHGQGNVAWRAKRDALAELPLMWRKRNKVQSLRTVSTLTIWHQLNKRFFR